KNKLIINKKLISILYSLTDEKIKSILKPDSLEQGLYRTKFDRLKSEITDSNYVADLSHLAILEQIQKVRAAVFKNNMDINEEQRIDLVCDTIESNGIDGDDSVGMK